MSIELTTEQLRAAPVRVIDPETNCEYVVVRSELFDRLKGVLEDDDARLLYPGLADLDPEDWEDASNHDARLS